MAEIWRGLYFGLGSFVPSHSDSKAPVGADVQVGFGPEKVPAHRLGGIQAPQLSYDHGTVFVHPGDVLRIGSLCLILVAESAAGRMYADRQPLAHAPSENVDQVDAVVAEFAVTKIPEPVPIVMDEIFMIGLHRGGPHP